MPLVAAYLDGSGRVTLLTSDVGQMNGLIVDRGNHKHGDMARLYWADDALQRIESIQIDGTGRQVVLAKGLTSPFSIAIMSSLMPSMLASR